MTASVEDTPDLGQRPRDPRRLATSLRETLIRDVIVATIVGISVGIVSGVIAGNIVADDQSQIDDKRSGRELQAAEVLAAQASHGPAGVLVGHCVPVSTTQLLRSKVSPVRSHLRMSLQPPLVICGAALRPSVTRVRCSRLAVDQRLHARLEGRRRMHP
jgi:hypothetical protein